MASSPFLDIASIDTDRVVFSLEDIQACNPQRFEFQQIDWVCHFDPSPEQRLIVGIRDLRPDEFWVRGHMPSSPLFPGVLMLEFAAQLGGIFSSKTLEHPEFHGFGGADEVRFRRVVRVGERLVMAVRAELVHPRRSRFRAQGFVGTQLVFEATLLGVAIPRSQL
jgi:3-hydroxyacyl-[acyl-carrier-protein] dehydratase